MLTLSNSHGSPRSGRREPGYIGVAANQTSGDVELNRRGRENDRPAPETFRDNVSHRIPHSRYDKRSWRSFVMSCVFQRRWVVEVAARCKIILELQMAFNLTGLICHPTYSSAKLVTRCSGTLLEGGYFDCCCTIPGVPSLRSADRGFVGTFCWILVKGPKSAS